MTAIFEYAFFENLFLDEEIYTIEKFMNHNDFKSNNSYFEQNMDQEYNVLKIDGCESDEMFSNKDFISNQRMYHLCTLMSEVSQLGIKDVKKAKDIRLLSTECVYEETYISNYKSYKLSKSNFENTLWSEKGIIGKLQHKNAEMWNILLNKNIITLEFTDVKNYGSFGFNAQFKVYLNEEAFDYFAKTNDVNVDSEDSDEHKKTIIERQYLKWALKKLFKLSNLVPEQNKLVSLVENVSKRRKGGLKAKLNKMYTNYLSAKVIWSVGESEGSIISLFSEEKKSENENKNESPNVIEEEESQQPDFFNKFVKATPSQNFISQLKPFQQQGLSWMLAREKYINLEDLYEEKYRTEIKNLDGINKFLWWKYKVGNQLEFYYNVFTGEISRNVSDDDNIRGGILADEMGLGKTVMTLALIHNDYVKRKAAGNLAEFETQPNKSKKLTSGKKAESPKLNKKELKSLKYDQKLLKNSKSHLSKASDCESLDVPKKTLIVTCSTLVNQWESELKLHSAPGSLSVYQYYEKKIRSIETALNHDVILTTYDIVAREYESVYLSKSKKPEESIFNHCWNRIVLDEGHIIRDRSTKRYKAVKQLNGINKWILTGTPIQNKVEDLYPLLSFIGVQALGDYYWFKNLIEKNKSYEEIIKKILKPILLRRTKESVYEGKEKILDLPEREKRTVFVTLSEKERKLYDCAHASTKNAFKTILDNYNEKNKQMMHIFKLITKLRLLSDHPILYYKNDTIMNEDVFKDNIEVFFSEKNSTENEAFINEVKNKIKDKNYEDCQICFEKIEIAALARCGHYTCSKCAEISFQSKKSCSFCRTILASSDIIIDDSKDWGIDQESGKQIAVMNEIEKVKNAGERVLVFSQFIGMLNLLAKSCEERGIQYKMITGSTSRVKRDDVIESFRKGQETVFLISFKLGCLGLNLVEANNVFLVDPWWNPALENQASDRVYRFGQTRNVKVLNFIGNNTIEERILELNEKKKKLAKGILDYSKGSAVSQKTSIDEMKFLLDFYEIPTN